jgi:GNAT superfamily N-acetyltransferase/ABC-type thiamine transport system ATPase subunit
MPIHRVHLTTPIRRLFRAEQVAGMFDLPFDELAGRLSHTLTAELPALDDDWTIGAIVGPSGSGKTTLARAAYGDAVAQPREWPEDEAIIDCLERAEVRGQRAEGRPGLTFKHLLRLLTAVGLASPPSWLKPYRVLSTGERFRADVARAVLGARDSLLVLDEFTSTLDRTVACTASYALAKFLRGNPLRFIVLSCHTDILPWLAPDWVLDLGGPTVQGSTFKVQSWKDKSTLKFEPGTLNAFNVERVPQKLWSRFAPHHYLSGGLSRAATCYAAFFDNKALTSGQGVGQIDADWRQTGCRGNTRSPFTPTTGRGFEPVAFCAVVAALGWKRTKRVTRLVVLPEYQGLGIGPRLAEEVAAIEAAKGNRVTITASHPAILGWCSRSSDWRYLGLKKTGSTRQHYAGRTIRSSAGRAVAAFEWAGSPKP